MSVQEKIKEQEVVAVGTYFRLHKNNIQYHFYNLRLMSNIWIFI